MMPPFLTLTWKGIE